MAYAFATTFSYTKFDGTDVYKHPLTGDETTNEQFLVYTQADLTEACEVADYIGWVDDTRLVADYAADTLTVTHSLRANSVESHDHWGDTRFLAQKSKHLKFTSGGAPIECKCAECKVPTLTLAPEQPYERSVTFGYTLQYRGTDVKAECWYCPNGKCEFIFSEFARLCPQSYDTERLQRAFAYAMLEHFSEHRDVNALPYIKSEFPAKTVTTPSGRTFTTPAKSVRWIVKGALLSKGTDFRTVYDTERESIASDWDGAFAYELLAV